MKKFLIVLALLASVSFSAFAKDSSDSADKEGWSKMTYYSVPILKVLESKEAFVIIYQKNHTGAGTTVIPKDWAYGNAQNPRKLKFRKIVPGALKPYLTVVKNDGEFHRVIMSVPMNKSHEVWGVLSQEVDSSELTKDSLEDLAL